SRQFKSMTVKMNRVIVSTFVLHDKAVALTGLYHQRINIRPGLTIDRPAVKASVTTRDFFEGEVEALVRFRCRRVRAKDGVIPDARWRLRPLRGTGLARIFDHNAHAHFPHAIFS